MTISSQIFGQKPKKDLSTLLYVRQEDVWYRENTSVCVCCLVYVFDLHFVKVTLDVENCKCTQYASYVS